jgi:hypothetical protein
MATKLNTYFVEVTDTFDGEANYCWVNRFKVRASTRRGAVIKVSRECGYQNRIIKVAEFGDESWHDVRGACIRIFASDDSDGDRSAGYMNVKGI